MKAIHLSALVLLALSVLSIAGCERHSKKEVYYLVAVNQSLPYWQTAAAGFKQAAEQYKVTAQVVGPASYDPQAELAELHKAISTRPAGILISVADISVLQSEIDAAVSAGIPVITMDSDAAGSRRLFFIGTNNLEAGRMGGQRVIQKLGGKGRVVFFTFTGQPNTEERLKGFKDAFSARPDIHIVDVVDVKGDIQKAFDWTRDSLGLPAAQKIDAYICLESASGKVVAEALQRAQVTDRLLMAWDANQDTLDAIKGGTIDATVAQKPYTMAYVGLKMLDEVFHAPPRQLGKDYSMDAFAPYPVFVDTGTAVVDKSNVDLYLAAAASH